MPSEAEEPRLLKCLVWGVPVGLKCVCVWAVLDWRKCLIPYSSSSRTDPLLPAGPKGCVSALEGGHGTAGESSPGFALSQ